MRIATPEELAAHSRATFTGGALGFGAGAAVAAPTLYAANRFIRPFRALPPSLKVGAAIFIIVPATVIQAEKAGLAFERKTWETLDVHERARRDAELASWRTAPKLSPLDRAQNWAANNKFACVGGGWVLGMSVALGVIMRDPLQTFPQKLVQARMWAQGWTIALVIGAAMASRSPVREQAVDHSWRQMIEENPVSTTKSS